MEGGERLIENDKHFDVSSEANFGSYVYWRFFSLHENTFFLHNMYDKAIAYVLVYAYKKFQLDTLSGSRNG
jgi:hypothetical protein